MQDLTVTLIQTEIIWEDRPANLAMLDRKLNEISEKTDVMVLPEMFTTGFSLNVEKNAEPMSGRAVSWLAAKAKEKKAHLLGSMTIAEDGKYFNRLVWAAPDGNILTYDKKHLFRMAGEHKVFTPGDRHLTVDVKAWKLRTFICYDVRFPVWCRNIDNQYDVAVYIANWPAKRAQHWKILLPARALENQCYVIGVNRVGKDGNGCAHRGDSCVVAPTGKILFRKANAPCVHTAKLSYKTLKEFRETFAAWQDADGDAVRFENQKKIR